MNPSVWASCSIRVAVCSPQAAPSPAPGFGSLEVREAEGDLIHNFYVACLGGERR